MWVGPRAFYYAGGYEYVYTHILYAIRIYIGTYVGKLSSSKTRIIIIIYCVHGGEANPTHSVHTYIHIYIYPHTYVRMNFGPGDK